MNVRMGLVGGLILVVAAACSSPETNYVKLGDEACTALDKLSGAQAVRDGSPTSGNLVLKAELDAVSAISAWQSATPPPGVPSRDLDALGKLTIPNSANETEHAATDCRTILEAIAKSLGLSQ